MMKLTTYKPKYTELNVKAPGYAIRVGNIPPKVKDEDIRQVFGQFGQIIDYRRPMNLSKHQPAAFAFIRYDDEHSSWRAIEEYDNTYLWENRISVQDANKQNSYFTQDTGFITNEEFDVPRPPPPDFDSTLPDTHYTIKRKEELKNNGGGFSVRIDDLPSEITKEMLYEIFSQYGEIVNVYVPTDLKHGCAPLGFAFVRFTHLRNAERAAQAMNGANLGVGRDIIVQVIEQKRYWSQDESNDFGKKKK